MIGARQALLGANGIVIIKPIPSGWVVLSTIFVGLEVINDPRLTLRLPDLFAALRCLDQLIRNHCLSE